MAVKAYAYTGDATFGHALANKMEAAGYTRTTDPFSAQVVLTYCLSQDGLEEAYLGSEGYVSSVSKGTLLIDFSPTTPGFARELEAVCLVSDLQFVEAPLVVTGGVEGKLFADSANLTCYAAGEDKALDAAAEILDMFAAKVVRTGNVGTAQLARAAYALQETGQLMSAIEADALRRAVGRNGVVLANAESEFGMPAVGSLSAAVLSAVHGQNYSGDYTVEMLMAQLSSALMAADDADLILPQAEAAMHLLELLGVVGGGQKAPSALALIYGDEAECAAQGLDWTRAEQTYGEDMQNQGAASAASEEDMLGEIDFSDPWDRMNDPYDHDDFDDYDDYEDLGYSRN